MQDLLIFIRSAVANLTDKKVRIYHQDGDILLIIGSRYYRDHADAYLYPDTWERVGRWLDETT